MRMKIKLINICIRHKCTNYDNNSKTKSLKKFQTKIIRRVKRSETMQSVKNTDLTSKLDARNSAVSSNYTSGTLNNNDTCNYDISNDAGMRNLHRSARQQPSPTISFDFLHVKANTAEMETSVNSEQIESTKSGQSIAIKMRDGKITKKIEVNNDARSVENWKEFNSLQRFSEAKIKSVLERTKTRVNENIEKLVEEKVDNDELSEKQPFKETDGESRFNALNMQMLSSRLYEQIFPNCCSKHELLPEKLTSLREELLAAGMNINETTRIPDVDIDLPSFEGKDIEEHFYNVAQKQTKAYLKIIHEILEGVPEMPEKWLLHEGWTRYTKDSVERVDHPLEDGVIFDVEVCMKEGPLPTLATAVTKNAWYGWVSKSLVEGNGIPVESRSLTTDVLIPMESSIDENGKKLSEKHKKPKIIIGHNVSYDRQRIKEQYWLNCTGARFVDTMSMHVAVSGLNSYQRSVLKTVKHEGKKEAWESVTSLNSLMDVYSLYCGRELDKKPRDVFVDGTLSEIREQFDDLMKYCAKDVVATYEILSNLFPMFEERFPHPVTLAGMLELGSAYLPVNSNWQRYIEESESTYEDLQYEAKTTLSKRADEVCKLIHDEKYKEDLWMWDQDWSVQPIKIKSTLTKAKRDDMEKELAIEKNEESDFEKYLTDGEDEIDPLEEQFRYLHKTKYLLPAKLPHMSGYPAWYRKLCAKYNEENWTPGPQNISTSMQITPKLLNLTWENYPLHYIREHGWGFLVPYNDDVEIKTDLPLKQLLAQCPLPNSGTKRDPVDYAMATLRTDVQNDLMKTEFWRFKKKKNKRDPPETFYKGSGIWCNVDIDNCCWFFKLPHKDGASRNVGNPLARDFLNKFSENVLAGLDSSAAQVLKIARIVSYWRNNRDRIMSQMVVWLKDDSLPNVTRKVEKNMRYGAIIPQVVVSGTLTRRATESTWMTASNASMERIGSELRAMVQAPPGYSIVGADVDSQELWIASVVGDAYCAGIHGATPFGWMTLIGTKTNGTDMHSVTAKAVGISRDHAKVINYARIYGAGQKFAERLLKQFNPAMSESEAVTKSRKMFSLTKGKRIYRLQKEYVNDDVSDRDYTAWESNKLAGAHGKSTEEMFEKGRWIGGTESAMFNRLEEIAGMEKPVTPFLHSRLSRALEGDGKRDDKYLPTKINWVVQSGAVDFLHLMLVSMRWLMRDSARFCLSFHDEVRYIVPNRYKYNAALAMHVTNLMTRAFCSSRLGIRDLPMSVAFFASVEVDTVLRKESSLDCKTPSNPHGLESGYGIPAGESLDVWTAIEKCGGNLGPWHAARNKRRSKIDEAAAPAIFTMSKATKRKHVTKELNEDVFEVPNNKQSIVRLIDSRGNNLHEIVDSMGERYLVSMPVKFRRNVWVKKGNFVLVEPIAEGDKVKAEIVKILTRDHIKYYKSQNCWPDEFDERETSENSNEAVTRPEDENESSEGSGDEDLFVNTNRQMTNMPVSRTGRSSSESSESD